MVQAGKKIKRNGIWLLPLSVRKDLAEKLYGGHNKLPQAAFHGRIPGSLKGHNQKIEGCRCATLESFAGFDVSIWEPLYPACDPALYAGHKDRNNESS